MKRLHRFIIRSFIGPFIITFSIAMFFLIMQFLWKYIDDLMGKGLEMSTIFELLFYVSATLIPLALPLAILFSSIMTFGNLAENNELTALKSAGLSLYKVMRPMLVFTVLLSVGAFGFTNYILPIANLKSSTIIYNIQTQKTAMVLTPGVFYNDLKGYTIKIDGKDQSTGVLYGVFIKEHKGFGGKTIKAKEGEMLRSTDSTFMLLKLTDGSMYEEKSISNSNRPSFPFEKSFFKEAIFKIDISDFNFQENDEDLFRSEYQMMNFIQLGNAIDSLEKMDDTISQMLINQVYMNITILNPGFEPKDKKPDLKLADSLNIPIIEKDEPKKTDTIISLRALSIEDEKRALVDAQGTIRSIKDNIAGFQVLKGASQDNINDYKTAWHQKFTLSIAIIVLFFIGAPLGAIIKKGGLGTPLVFATLFFLLYYILTMTGENMVETGYASPWFGMWLSTIILTPLGIFLTLKAANDSALFDRDAYKKYFRRIISKKN